jgi:8-oxo-dGTP diphosphatase
MVENVDKALKILKNEPIKNSSIIYTLENDLDSVCDLKIIDNSILVRKTSDSGWVMISSSDDQELSKVLYNLSEEDKDFACVEKWIADKIISWNENRIEWKETTYRFYLPIDKTLPDIKSHIRPLRTEDADIVNQYWEYRDDGTINYVRNMIIKNYSAGIEEDGKLVAWLTIHDDGALGFLYVLEDYRGKGYAKDLTVYICNKLRKNNKTPFLYIVTENIKSLSLAQKLGFKRDRKICWFSLK